jgi:putative hemolysin
MSTVNSLWFSAQYSIERLPFLIKLFSQRKVQTSEVTVDIENDQYHIKIATEPEELLQVLRLRFEVFFQEFSTNKVSFPLFRYDIDMYDFFCDHLIVKEKKTNQVIACYRLLPDSAHGRSKSFYTQNEFQFDEVLNLPGKKIELGRACVHKDYRKGTVISLLWRGLLSYAKQSGARYLFGCSSISGEDFKHLPHIMGTLKKHNAFIEGVDVRVQPDFSLKNHPEVKLDFELGPDEVLETKHLASLIHMYLLAGAKVAKGPAYDEEFHCLDLFTLIDLQKMPSSFERRFG